MSNVTTVTASSVVTSFTTYCPLSTTFTIGNETITTSGYVTLSKGPYTLTSASASASASASSSSSKNISSNSTLSAANAAGALNGAAAGASVVGAFALAAFLL